MKIKVITITGEVALDQRFGQEVFRQTSIALSHNESVELDFAGIKIFGRSFLNFALGQLYRDYTPQKITQNITLKNLPHWTSAVVTDIVENAKQFYGW